MVAKRSTKMGKIQPYIDVKSKDQIPQFESLLKMGPIIVLVYADWCGHCTKFKQSMWDEVAKSPNKTVNTAAVHYDMVNNTSMRNAKIEGYPTLFEISNTKTPKPIPTPHNKNDLMTLVNSNVSMSEPKNMNMNMNEPKNMNMDMSEPKKINMNENMLKSQRMEMNSTAATSDTFEPASIESLPPDIEMDTVLTNEVNTPSSVQGGGYRGGSLMESLLKVAADTAHVALLTSSAVELSHRYKKHKKSRKAKALSRRSGKKRSTRRQ